MLSKLTVKNMALIDFAEIEFDKGLNVLSGETGSGKSVLLESINFVLGAKADKTLIRSGEEYCQVTAEFDISTELKDVFDELDVEFDKTLIITRKLSIDGKSSIKVNGNSVSQTMLKKFTSRIVDVHGQSDHFYLLKNSNQLDLIDKFSADESLSVKEEIKKDHSKYTDIIRQIDELGGDEQKRAIRLDVLNYQIDEINNVDFKENEDVELQTLKTKLKNIEKIGYALNLAKSSVEDEGGISDILNNTIKALSSITNISEEYSALKDGFDEVYDKLNDLTGLCSDYIDSLDTDGIDVNYVEERLEKIKNIKKKYGQTYEEIQVFLQNACEEKQKLENFDALYQSLLEEKVSICDKLYNEYVKLSNIRKKYSKVFIERITKELRELGMKNAEFDIKFIDIPSKEECKYPVNGIDEIEFMFSANTGEPLKLLSAVISGGEISRFMLAIKSQTAGFTDISTFIFDEIDAGISGEIAKTVAKKFYQISKTNQIIAISHLPQICVMADNNLLIYKKEQDGKTRSFVEKLTLDRLTDEVIRLVGGEIGSETSRKHATELIENAKNLKQSI